MKSLLAIDGNSILNRAFYGIKPLTNSAGLPTHAVMGMINILLSHIEALHPDSILCAFDRKEPTFRHLRYEGYKATRHGMPQELAVQLPYAKRAVQALGIPLVSLAGYEADDILGTAAAFADAEEDLCVYLLTGDRDAFQLIRDRVHVIYAKTGGAEEVDRALFGEKYPGVTPERFVDLKALMGDASDNIPGVPGIGEKTALRLIAEYGSLDALYASLADAPLTPSVKKKLTEGKESAALSRELSCICRTAPIGLTPTDCAWEGFDLPALRALLDELELYQLRARLLRGEAAAGATEATAEAKVLAEEQVSPCALLTGLTGQIGLELGEEDVTVSDGKCLRRAAFTSLTELAPLFAYPEIALLDAKPLHKRLAAQRIPLKSSVTDITLCAYLLDPTASGYAPDRLAKQYLARENAGALAPFCAEIAPILTEALKKTGQLALYEEIERPLTRVLAQMEEDGFRIDRAGMAAFGESLAAQCKAYQAEAFEAAGEEFNLNSPKQLGSLLFEKLMLPPPKKTRTGYSTDAETLEKLRPYHPVIDAILDYRKVQKLKSTYADGLLRLADENGVIHSIFHQTVTATGRLSSSEPNLQNIPIKTDLGREFRKYFIPSRDDYLLIDADYSQIELRLLACIAGDEEMLEDFRSGIDIHTSTASKVFGVPTEAVTPELRKRAKAVNFGIIYGIGDYSLSQDLGISRKQAAAYIEQYLTRYPAVRAYLDGAVQNAAQNGFTSTLFGRVRPIPELKSPRKPEQAFGRRVAMNAPIQGTAADIMKIAMINVSAKLKNAGLDARLILQVHDELILEAHPRCAEQAAAILRDAMENAVTLPIPLTVEMGMGKTWYEC